MESGFKMKPELEATVGKWKYKYCSVTVGDSALSRGCQVCGRHTRYGHTLLYPKELGRVAGTFENYLFAGVDCAAKLLPSEHSEIPRLAENETKRKEGWRIHYENFGECITTVDNLIERGIL